MRRTRIGFSVLLILLLWLGWTNFTITTTQINISNESIPAAFDGLAIAHVSDLHNKEWGEQLIKKIKKEEPDLIAITGDLVDSAKTDFDVALTFVQAAQKIAPVYYVTGNHEAWLEDYSVLKKQLEQAKVNMMDNEAVLFEKESSHIQIVGVQDPDFREQGNRGNMQGEMIRQQMDELLLDETFTLVLSHRPEHFDQYVAAGADVVLTGHAHGGQVRLPLIGGVVAPNQGFFPKYSEGVYTKDQTAMVVSRGLGNSIIPLRINNTPELVIVRLTKEDTHVN